MKKPFKKYTKAELDKLMDKKFRAICDKYDWNAQWMEARDNLLDWYDSKLKLIT